MSTSTVKVKGVNVNNSDEFHGTLARNGFTGLAVAYDFGEYLITYDSDDQEYIRLIGELTLSGFEVRLFR